MTGSKPLRRRFNWIKNGATMGTTSTTAIIQCGRLIDQFPRLVIGIPLQFSAAFQAPPKSHRSNGGFSYVQ